MVRAATRRGRRRRAGPGDAGRADPDWADLEQARRWALEAELLLAERDRQRTDRDHRRGAAGAPVGVAAGGAAARSAAAGPPAAPAAARGARLVRPPGHRVPPVAGAAASAGRAAARPRRPARLRRRRRGAATASWRSCRRRSWPASGPTGCRTGSRCRSRPWWPASSSAAGWTPCSRCPGGRPLRRHRLEDRPAADRGRRDRGRGAARRVPPGLGRAGRGAGRAGRRRLPLRARRRHRPPGRSARRTRPGRARHGAVRLRRRPGERACGASAGS